MGEHAADQKHLSLVIDVRNQPMLVAANVEYGLGTNLVGTRENLPQFRKIAPLPARYYSEPVIERQTLSACLRLNLSISFRPIIRTRAPQEDVPILGTVCQSSLAFPASDSLFQWSTRRPGDMEIHIPVFWIIEHQSRPDDEGSEVSHHQEG